MVMVRQLVVLTSGVLACAVATAAILAYVNREEVRFTPRSDAAGGFLDLPSGEVAVEALLRALCEQSGRPVRATKELLDQTVRMLSEVPKAGEDVIVAILEANGYLVIREPVEILVARGDALSRTMPQ